MKNNKNVKPYSDKEISLLTTGKVSIANKNSDITDFINEIYHLKSSNKKLYLGMVKDKLAQEIYDKLKNQHNKL